MKFYKRDPDAALAGMAELTLQERGAYNTLMDLLYSRDGVVRDDDDMIRRVMNCHGNEWRAVKAKLIAKAKIWIEDGYIKANRVDATLSEASDFSDTQRARINKRWEKEGKRRGNAPDSSGIRPTNAPQTSDKRAAKNEIGEQDQTPGNTKAGNTNTPTATATPTKESPHAARDELFSEAPPSPKPTPPKTPEAQAEADLYSRGKQLLGEQAGGLIRKLLDAKGRNVALARAALETASTKINPREYLAGAIRGRRADTAGDDDGIWRPVRNGIL